MGETIFFTSDTHFGHERITVLGRGRPFGDAEEMTEALVARWNERVTRSDRVYHLGDFSFLGQAGTLAVVARLRGRIHLIRGNHDRVLDAPAFAARFESRQDYKELSAGGQRLVLFHYPIASWNGAHKGSWHLHGHCHGSLAEDPAVARMDVGVDCTGYAPVSFEEVSERLAGRGWVAPDHHGAG